MHTIYSLRQNTKTESRNFFRFAYLRQKKIEDSLDFDIFIKRRNHVHVKIMHKSKTIWSSGSKHTCKTDIGRYVGVYCFKRIFSALSIIHRPSRTVILILLLSQLAVKSSFSYGFNKHKLGCAHLIFLLWYDNKNNSDGI